MVEANQRVKPEVLADLLRQGMARGQRPFLVITSGSMRPLLRVDDAVQLELVQGSELCPGDLLTLQDTTVLVTHRFCGWWLGEDGQYLVTRGDRSLVLDVPWRPSQLVGRVVARRRQNRWVSVRTGWGGWLSRHVARLAAAEERLFHLSNIPPGFSVAPVTRLGRSDVLTGFIRRLIYLWLTLFVGLIELASVKTYP